MIEWIKLNYIALVACGCLLAISGLMLWLGYYIGRLRFITILRQQEELHVLELNKMSNYTKQLQRELDDKIDSEHHVGT